LYQGIALAIPQVLGNQLPLKCVRANSSSGTPVEESDRESSRRRVCVRTHFREIRWNSVRKKSSPGGANELSPALQRLLRNSLCARARGKAASNLSPGGAIDTSPALPALGKVGRMIEVPEGRPSFVTASSALGKVEERIQVPEGRPSSHAHSLGAGCRIWTLSAASSRIFYF
jgi:hypothetical protein